MADSVISKRVAADSWVRWLSDAGEPVLERSRSGRDGRRQRV